MIYLKLVVLGLELVNQLLRYMQEKRLLDEGARQEIQRQLEQAAKIVARAKEIQNEVGKMTDAQVDAALERDYRD